MVSYIKNKAFKNMYYNAGNQSYQRKVVPQVNLVMPPIMNKLIN